MLFRKLLENTQNSMPVRKNTLKLWWCDLLKAWNLDVYWIICVKFFGIVSQKGVEFLWKYLKLDFSCLEMYLYNRISKLHKLNPWLRHLDFRSEKVSLFTILRFYFGLSMSTYNPLFFRQIWWLYFVTFQETWIWIITLLAFKIKGLKSGAPLSANQMMR